MKKRNVLIAMILIVASILSLTVVSSAEYSWSDIKVVDFEDGSTFGATTKASVSIATEANGNKYERFTGTAGDADCAALNLNTKDQWAVPSRTMRGGSTQKPSADSRTLTFSLSIKADPEVGFFDGGIKMKGVTASANEGDKDMLYWGTDGIIKISKNGTEVGTLSTTEWLNITLSMDLAGNTLTVFVNGKLAGIASGMGWSDRYL